MTSYKTAKWPVTKQQNGQLQNSKMASYKTAKWPVTKPAAAAVVVVAAQQ